MDDRQSNYDKLYFGKSKGCNFESLACGSTISPEFCANFGTTSCDFTLSGSSICQSESYSDNCLV